MSKPMEMPVLLGNIDSTCSGDDVASNKRSMHEAVGLACDTADPNSIDFAWFAKCAQIVPDCSAEQVRVPSTPSALTDISNSSSEDPLIVDIEISTTEDSLARHAIQEAQASDRWPTPPSPSENWETYLTTAFC